MTSQRDGQAVLLPAELYEQIARRVAASSFGSVDEYVIFVLEEVIKDEPENQPAFSEEEEEEVKRRLKGLGYLD